MVKHITNTFLTKHYQRNSRVPRPYKWHYSLLVGQKDVTFLSIFYQYFLPRCYFELLILNSQLCEFAAVILYFFKK